MFSFLFLIWFNTQAEPAMDQAAQWVQAGNYLMAEAELLNADPGQDPLRAGKMLFEIAVRTNNTIGKQQFILTDLIAREGWATAAQIAALGLTQKHQDWESYVLVAGPFLGGSVLRDHPIRFRVLYHLARHTTADAASLNLSSSERQWFQACRALPPNRTWPDQANSGWPFLFENGYLFEAQGSFQPPQVSGNATFEDKYLAGLFRIRNALNQSELENAAIGINQVLAMNSQTPAARLKTYFYQLSLEYFQRKDLLKQAQTTASNLDAVRKRAFLPIRSWPDAVLAAKNQRSAMMELPEPAPIPADEAPVSAVEEPIATESEATANTTGATGEGPLISKPSMPETDDGSKDETQTESRSEPERQPEARSEENPPANDAATEAQAPEEAQQPKIEPAPEAAPEEDLPTPEIPAAEPAPAAEDAATAMSQPAENAETLPDEGRGQPIQPPMDEPEQIDPNLAVASALLADGDLLMAEAQFMAVNPRQEDILTLGFHLAEIALRSNSVANKTAFYRDYLERSDPWRGVALTVLSIFSAKHEDWPVFQQHASQLLNEFGPFQDPKSYRMIYHLARYTKSLPRQLRPIQALWFEKCRALSQYSVYPEIADPSLPYAYRWAGFLEAGQAFQLPDPPPATDEEGVYLHHLLQIRAALNAGDLNAAARGINTLKSLPRETIDYQWRTVFQQLSREYFEKRGDMDSAMVAGRNADHYARGTALQLVSFPDRAAQITEWVSNEALVYREPAIPEPEPEVETEAETSETPPVAEEADPAVSVAQPTSTPPEPDLPQATLAAEDDLDWEGFDRALQKGDRSLELKIRAKEAETTYARIYKSYLLGTIYLRKGRYQSAYERLALAENLVRELPFPLLESKVMLAMADYYDAERNDQQANWYRIAAVQLWTLPTNLALFAGKADEIRRSPFPEIIDQGLKSVTTKGSIHNLLYYSELGAFLALREKAYLRENLSANAVLSSQIKQVGDSMAAMIDTLATNPDADITPRRYNETLELWNGLWEESYPYFKDDQVPGLAVIQSQLLPEERLLVFVEGQLFFGALYITENQNFAVSLGNISNFRRLDHQSQFDFLEGRLGPVWNHKGALTLKLSESFRNEPFLNHLYQRMPNPERLRFASSLKALIMREPDKNCGPTLCLDVDSTLRVPESAEGDAPETAIYHGGQITRSLLFQKIENYRHIAISGAFSIEEDGLILQPDSLRFNLSELPRYQPKLCSLTLIAPSGPSFLDMLDELAFLQVRSGPAIEIRLDWPQPETASPDYGLAYPIAKSEENPLPQ